MLSLRLRGPKVCSPLRESKFWIMAHNETYQTCIDACLKCASICNHCASACLEEEDVKKMARCIQLDMECAATCYAAAQVMSMNGQYAEEICRICADICFACGEECEKHSNMDHCRECAEACRKCAEECRKMVGATA